jgi:flagellar biogenesis protein FliO
MALKKWILLVCVLMVSILSAADKKEPPSPPSSTEQTAPSSEVPAPLPSSEEMTTSYEGAFVRMIVTLLGLLVLVFATFWILRKLGKGKFKLGSGRTINIIEKRALSPKSVLFLVEIGNKKVLISESQLEVRALASVEELPEVNE